MIFVGDKTAVVLFGENTVAYAAKKLQGGTGIAVYFGRNHDAKGKALKRPPQTTEAVVTLVFTNKKSLTKIRTHLEQLEKTFPIHKRAKKEKIITIDCSKLGKKKNEKRAKSVRR